MAQLVAGLYRAILPKVITHARPPPPVFTQKHSAGQMLGPRKKRGKAGGLGFCAGAQVKGCGLAHAAASDRVI